MIMTQIVLNIEDASILPSLKRILGAIKGVSLVSQDNTLGPSEEEISESSGFQEAMEDKRCGRVYHAESTEDMFKQILG